MKKTLTVIVASLLLVMPMPVYAIDTQDENNAIISRINEITFEKLQDETLERNPTVKTLNNGVLSLINSFDLNQLNLIKNMNESGLLQQVGNLKTLRQTAQTDLNALPLGDPGIAIKEAEITNYDSQIASLNAQLEVISNLKSSNDINKSQTVQKLALTSEMMKDIQVWSAQNYYLAFNNLLITQEDLQSSRALVQNSLNITRVRRDLGMATSLDVKAAESQSKDLDRNAKVLNDNLSSFRGALNLLFGQEYNTALEIKSIPELDEGKISSMNYDADLQMALNNSLTLMLAQNARGTKKTAFDKAADKGVNAINLAKADLDTEDIKVDDAKKKLEQAFDKAFNAVKDGQKDLQREKDRISDEQKQYEILTLKLNLGMISQVEYDAGTATYHGQLNKLKTAHHVLFKAYLAYDWMIKGLDTVSSSSVSSSDSSYAAGQL